MKSSLLVLPQISPFVFGEESVNSGDLVSVTCSVSKGDSPISFEWFLNGNPITEGNRKVQLMKVSSRISTLSVESVEAEHTGLYTCTAKNLAGTTNHSTYLNVNGI